MGSGAMTNSMDEVFKADVIFITGSNTTWNHPVFGSMIKQAVKKHGKKLIVADPRSIDLAEIADVYMRQKNGSDVAATASFTNDKPASVSIVFVVLGKHGPTPR